MLSIDSEQPEEQLEKAPYLCGLGTGEWQVFLLFLTLESGVTGCHSEFFVKVVRM